MKRKLLLLSAFCFLLSGCVRRDAAASLPAPVETEAPAVAVSRVAPSRSVPLLNEAMSHNRTTPVEGRLCDWVELCNATDGPISLGGLFISKDPEKKRMQALPDETMSPGDYLILTEYELGFRLNKDGETLYIFDSEGNELDSLCIPALEDNESFVRSLGVVDYPSPGKSDCPENAGGSTVECGLVISEACTVNDRGLPAGSPDTCDWLELRNESGESLSLEGYYLSDDMDEPRLYPLSGTLASGECLLIRLPEDSGPFALSSAGESVYLTEESGTICDILNIPYIPADCSYGKEQGRCLYYAVPTPGMPNSGGSESICAEPVVSVASGWYEEPFTVTLSGEGDIYYTLDGSLPTKSSRLYRGESISVKSSLSLRARSYDGNRIPSLPVTVNYFLNALPLTLDVVKISMDPKETQTVLNKASVAKTSASIALYVDGVEQFSESCGISVQGSGSRIYEKRSYQIDFRSRYGKTALHYKLFDKIDQSEFTTIALRSGSQDQCAACMRDEIISDLFFDCSEDLLTFCYRPVSLYVNEDYRGVYFIRERCKASTVAYRYGVKEDSCYVVRSMDSPGLNNEFGNDFFKLTKYIRTHDMSKQENFDALEEMLNIDGLIDFFCELMWSNNYDVNNIRFFRSEADNGRWQLILYDNDVAFYRDNYSWVRMTLQLYMGMLNNLMRNEGFKERYTLRFGELLRGPLNEDAVIGRIRELESILDHDMEYNCKLYPGVTDYKKWKRSVNDLCEAKGRGIRGVTDNVIKQYIRSVALSDELIERAFGKEYCKG